jgi:predicted alpha/beta-hydrolase family hydrolase
MASVRDEAQALANSLDTGTDRLVLGGRSMGGRMCSLAVTGSAVAGEQVKGKSSDDVAHPLPAAGLVLISYPLHPPGKPDRLRVEHFPHIKVPCLFISGTRDPFGSPDEFDAHTTAIPGPVTQVWVEGGRHDLKGADADIVDAVQEWLTSL